MVAVGSIGRPALIHSALLRCVTSNFLLPSHNLYSPFVRSHKYIRLYTSVLRDYLYRWSSDRRVSSDGLIQQGRYILLSVPHSRTQHHHSVLQVYARVSRTLRLNYSFIYVSRSTDFMKMVNDLYQMKHLQLALL